MITKNHTDLSYSAKLALELLVRSDGVYQGRPMLPSTTEAWGIYDLMPFIRTHAKLSVAQVEGAFNELVETGYLQQCKNGHQKGRFKFTPAGNTFRNHQRKQLTKTGIRYANPIDR